MTDLKRLCCFESVPCDRVVCRERRPITAEHIDICAFWWRCCL